MASDSTGVAEISAVTSNSTGRAEISAVTSNSTGRAEMSAVTSDSTCSKRRCLATTSPELCLALNVHTLDCCGRIFLVFGISPLRRIISSLLCKYVLYFLHSSLVINVNSTGGNRFPTSATTLSNVMCTTYF